MAIILTSLGFSCQHRLLARWAFVGMTGDRICASIMAFKIHKK